MTNAPETLKSQTADKPSKCSSKKEAVGRPAEKPVVQVEGFEGYFQTDRKALAALLGSVADFWEVPLLGRFMRVPGETVAPIESLGVDLRQFMVIQ
jgi:hypothetical protein